MLVGGFIAVALKPTTMSVKALHPIGSRPTNASMDLMKKNVSNRVGLGLKIIYMISETLSHSGRKKSSRINNWQYYSCGFPATLLSCGSFRKLGVPYFGVLIIRIRLFRYYIRVPYFRKLPCMPGGDLEEGGPLLAFVHCF